MPIIKLTTITSEFIYPNTKHINLIEPYITGSKVSITKGDGYFYTFTKETPEEIEDIICKTKAINQIKTYTYRCEHKTEYVIKE